MRIELTYNIKKIRINRNISLRQLAEKSTVSTSQINDIENNKKHPTVYTLCLIAIALNVKCEDLINLSVITEN